MDDVPPETERHRALPPHVRVQVRCRYNGGWVSGFEIVETGHTGYWLRRSSDRAALPVEFRPDDVRAIDDPGTGR
jgi:hypothetical protein